MAEELFKDGKVSGVGDYRDGLPDGFWQRWYSTGELMDEGTYDVGRTVSEWVTYAADGSESKHKTFK